MNKIKYLTIFSIGVFTLTTSCQDELNQLSPTKVATEVALSKDPAAFQTAVDAAYDTMKSSGYFTGDTSQLGVVDEMTDNLVLNPQGRQTNFLAYNWNLNSTLGSVTNIFSQAYNVIANANLPLKYIDNLPESQAKNNIIAQAKAIRAIAHFDLVIRFSKIPTQSADAGSSMGIDYITVFDPLMESGGGRKLTVNQTYDKIIEDLTSAASLMDNTMTNVGRITKPAIYGMLSRVYLYKGDYANAITAGQQSIALKPSVGSLANFKLIWSSNNTDGVLFKILNSTVEGVTTGVVYQQGATAAGGNIKSEYVVPKSLFDFYSSTDIRKSSYIRTSAYTAGGVSTTRNHVIKYAVNTGDATPLNVVEVKYLRTAEVYLNVAEAAFKTGNEVLANQMLNKLRENRYTDYAQLNLTGSDLWNKIMLERRLELAFENDRLFTLKRLGLPMQRTGEGANVDGTGVAALTQLVAASSYKWQWPIPQSAINLDKALPQNPGY